MAGHPNVWMDHQGSTTYDKPNFTQNGHISMAGHPKFRSTDAPTRTQKERSSEKWKGMNLHAPPHVWPLHLAAQSPPNHLRPTSTSPEGAAPGRDDETKLVQEYLTAISVMQNVYNSAETTAEASNNVKEIKGQKIIINNEWDKTYAPALQKMITNKASLSAKYIMMINDRHQNMKVQICNTKKRLRDRIKALYPTDQPAIISQNFLASGLIPPIMTPKSLSETMCSDAPTRAGPPEQEQQELDDSKSSSLDKQWAGANVENLLYPGPLTAQPSEKWANESRSSSFEEKQGQSTTSFAAKTQGQEIDSKSDERATGSDDEKILSVCYETQVVEKFDSLATANRRAYFEDGRAFDDWAVFLAQPGKHGQVLRPSQLVPQSPSTQNSRPGIISKNNFTNNFPSSGLIPPIITQMSSSKTMKSSETPVRARPPEQEQQELDDSRSSSFEEQWAASFRQEELNFTNTFQVSGLIPPIMTQKSLSKTKKNSETPEQELDDSSTCYKTQVMENFDSLVPPDRAIAATRGAYLEAKSYNTKATTSSQEKLVDSRSNKKTWALQAHEEVRPREQWTTSPNLTSVSASEDKCVWTSTTIDQWWYLQPESLYQGEPPPKNRRLDTSLLRPNKGKRTRIKEDLQGQVSLQPY
jgi:hypothetical protein